MDRAIAKKWSAALRSGNYTQGKGWLRDKFGNFCCLGVLCDISGLGTWVNYAYSGPGKEEEFYDGVYTPTKVAEWASTRGDGITFYDKNYCRIDFTLLNDDGKSFSEIADVIDEQWEQI
jgi:hypothetical protein